MHLALNRLMQLHFSHGLVCRIAHDADAHHPRHSHESHSVHPVPGELAAHSDYGDYYGGWRVSPLFASRDITRLCSVAAPLLATSAVDVDLLCGVDASHQDLAHP